MNRDMEPEVGKAHLPSLPRKESTPVRKNLNNPLTEAVSWTVDMYQMLDDFNI